MLEVRKKLHPYWRDIAQIIRIRIRIIRTSDILTHSSILRLTVNTIFFCLDATHGNIKFSRPVEDYTYR